MPEVSRPSSDLRVRVVTAVLLALVVLATLALGGPWGWAVLVLVFALIAVWEGARLVGSGAVASQSSADPIALALGSVAVICALVLGASSSEDASDAVMPVMRMWLLLALLYWLIPVPIGLARTRIATATPLGALSIALVVGATVLSVVLLHRKGVSWLVAALVIAVVADVAGYFVGRRWGRVKLAPQVSPKKTREGAIGGLLAASVWVAATAWLAGLTESVVGVLIATMAGALLGMLSILGDLWESQLKRQAGVKDSSNLLPGHGGVLDRIDAQLAVLPGVTLALMLLEQLP
ncbi:MAG: phosphatidate cytidylyltransferase [Casimicrobiaceae bacterium]